jgi:hypothetical protein
MQVIRDIYIYIYIYTRKVLKYRTKIIIYYKEELYIYISCVIVHSVTDNIFLLALGMEII